MPTAPYLIFGIDVDHNGPNVAAILACVHDSFPITSGIGSLGLDNVYLVEVPGPQATAVFTSVSAHLANCDRIWNGQLRWFVQLCQSAQLSGG